MRTNLVIAGDCEKINKGVAEYLAPLLELNFLDFDGYCEYINMINREQFCEQYGKRKYNELQKDALPHMQDFCDSVIGFDKKLSNLPSIFKLLSKTSYIVCIAEASAEKYKKYTDIWIDLKKKSIKQIANEIIKKLGEI